MRSFTGSKLGAAAFIAVSLFSVAPSAIGGTNNAFAFVSAPTASAPVVTLQDNVTYSDPKNDTQAGFVVGDFGGSGLLLKQTSGNALNKVTVTFEASVTNPDEKLSFRDPDFYLAGLPKECGYSTAAANPQKITCFFRQTKPGFTFPAFVVFFNAPAQAGTGPDTISTKISLLYSEGTNGGDPSPINSSQESSQPNLVALGTINPIKIKTAVGHFGGTLSSGAGGVPSSDNKATIIAKIPTLSDLFTTAELSIGVDGACSSHDRFVDCPTFDVTIPGTFAFLTTIYRFDASNLKMQPNPFFNSLTIEYFATPTSNVEIVGACPAKDTPRGDGIPCINRQVCYKNNAPGGLANDCEVETINTKNGLTRFR